MNNHVAFFIICAAWDRLVEGKSFDCGDALALEILSRLKSEIIFDPATDQSRLRTIIDAQCWKHAMHEEILEAAA